MGMQVPYWCDLRSLLEVRACAITSIRDISTTKCLVSDERCEAVGNADKQKSHLSNCKGLMHMANICEPS